MSLALLACLVATAAANSAQDGCLFDGRIYKAGDVITIQPCLARMTCDGHNSYSNMQSLGGVCPEKEARTVDGQSGCLFDGHVYKAGDVITIQPCLAQMTCAGRNSYTNAKSLGGVCPEKEARAVDGQDGCLFDGRVYSAGDVISIEPCLAQMTCQGHNSYSNVKSLGGVCPGKEARAVNGQVGCLFDGHVYNPGEVLTIQPCLARMTCAGHNSYSNVMSLGGQC